MKHLVCKLTMLLCGPLVVQKMLTTNAYTSRSVRASLFFMFYVDDLLLASSDVGLLHEAKQIMSKTFDM